MTIPERKLKLKELNFDDLTLDDIAVFTGNIEGVSGLMTLRNWLEENAENWTRAEIGRIRISDLPNVIDMVVEEVNGQSVPLEK